MNQPSTLQDLFDYIDRAGVGGGTGEVSVRMGNREMLTVRAGGPGIHSWPAEPPFLEYDVLLDHEPPRFWSRYTDADGLLFSRVPRLLLTHHITRHGGVLELSCERTVRERIGFFKVQMLMPMERENAILSAIKGIQGVKLTSSEFLVT